MHWLKIVAVIFLCSAAGCATPGDPSCAVHDEINDQSCLKRALYHPAFDPVGLQKTTWYNCPTAWTPECPGVECGFCDSHPSSATSQNRIDQPSTAVPLLPDAFKSPVKLVAD